LSTGIILKEVLFYNSIVLKNSGLLLTSHSFYKFDTSLKMSSLLLPLAYVTKPTLGFNTSTCLKTAN
jgi:hypothetical protein